MAITWAGCDRGPGSAARGARHPVAGIVLGGYGPQEPAKKRQEGGYGGLAPGWPHRSPPRKRPPDSQPGALAGILPILTDQRVRS